MQDDIECHCKVFPELLTSLPFWHDSEEWGCEELLTAYGIFGMMFLPQVFYKRSQTHFSKSNKRIFAVDPFEKLLDEVGIVNDSSHDDLLLYSTVFPQERPPFAPNPFRTSLQQSSQ